MQSKNKGFFFTFISTGSLNVFFIAAGVSYQFVYTIKKPVFVPNPVLHCHLTNAKASFALAGVSEVTDFFSIKIGPFNSYRAVV
jgi:hypothetical protein